MQANFMKWVVLNTIYNNIWTVNDCWCIQPVGFIRPNGDELLSV